MRLLMETPFFKTFLPKEQIQQQFKSFSVEIEEKHLGDFMLHLTCLLRKTT